MRLGARSARFARCAPPAPLRVLHHAAPLLRPRQLVRRAVQQAEALDESDSFDGGVPCSPAFVTSDNSHPAYTRLSIEVADYPGLLRVFSWVLNGLGCRVHNAVMKTDEAGGASDVFWVTDLRGRKLSDAAATDAVERLEEFLTTCAPPPDDTEFTEFACGNVAVSNSAHPSCTQVTITADLYSPGLLLDIASVISAQGLSVVEAVVRGGEDNPIPPGLVADPEHLPQPPPGKRVLRFFLRLAGRGAGRGPGGKLEVSHVSALLFNLQSLLGESSRLPLTPPNSELNSACMCSTSSSPTATQD